MRGHGIGGVDFQKLFPFPSLFFWWRGIDLSTILGNVHRKTNSIVVVRDVPRNAGILLNHLSFARYDIHAVNIVIFVLATVIDADEYFRGEFFADFVDFGGDFFDRGQILDFTVFQIHAVDVIVFVAVFVLRVEQVLTGIGTLLIDDAAMRIVRHGLGCRRVTGWADPDIQDTVDRSGVGQ